MGRCGACRLGLPTHDTTDPLCEVAERCPCGHLEGASGIHGPGCHLYMGRHVGPWPVCRTCGYPENRHPFRHPFVVDRLAMRRGAR